MFDVKRLILLFSIMVMGIVGVKANPCKCFVISVPPGDSSFKNAKCSNCECYLSKSKEQSKKFGSLVAFLLLSKVNIHAFGKDVGLPIFEEDRQSDFYFVSTYEKDSKIERRCLNCMIEHARQNNQLIDFKQICSEGFFGEQDEQEIKESMEKKIGGLEYDAFFTCIRMPCKYGEKSFEDLDHPKCCHCESESDISELDCSKTLEHIIHCDICQNVFSSNEGTKDIFLGYDNAKKHWPDQELYVNYGKSGISLPYENNGIGVSSRELKFNHADNKDTNSKTCFNCRQLYRFHKMMVCFKCGDTIHWGCALSAGHSACKNEELKYVRFYIPVSKS